MLLLAGEKHIQTHYSVGAFLCNAMLTMMAKICRDICLGKGSRRRGMAGNLDIKLKIRT
jgi:hypothetical protein